MYVKSKLDTTSNKKYGTRSDRENLRENDCKYTYLFVVNKMAKKYP